jgi:hypothetical protein
MGRYLMTRLGCICVMAALALAGCGTPTPINEILFLETARGIAVVRAGAGAPTFAAAGAVPSRDWSRVISTSRQQHTTRVSAFIPASGTRLWTSRTPGNLKTKVVSEDGNLAVLGPARERHYTQGRSQTHLVVAASHEPPRVFDLRGNFEPEAFSTNGDNIFVLQYRPARAPRSYQVRRLDLTTGKIHDVYTPDAHLQEAMRGDARIQTVSPDGSYLYTLYTLRGHDGPHAFIHVLNLDEMWAHCIDLPEPFGSAADSTALTTSPSGDALYVANGATGSIATVDPEALRVVNTADVDFGKPRPTSGAVGGDTLYLANKTSLAAVDLKRMSIRRTWSLPERISGLQVTKDGGHVYVGLKDRVVVLDGSNGKRLRTWNPPGVKRIGGLGRTTRTINDVPKQFSCAC